MQISYTHTSPIWERYYLCIDCSKIIGLFYLGPKTFCHYCGSEKITQKIGRSTIQITEYTILGLRYKETHKETVSFKDGTIYLYPEREVGWNELGG